MYLGGKEIFLDQENGYFIYVDDQNQIRLYLPKNEFFTSMAGKVKSIVAYKTCADACKSKGGNGITQYGNILYTVIYKLEDPKNAMLTQVMTPEGLMFVDSGDISRGWKIDYNMVKETGYYNVGNQNLDSSQTDYSYDTSSFKELTMSDYAEEFARSEFDIWYDSFGGTALTVIAAVVVSALSEGTLAPFMFEWVASQGARTLGTFAIKQLAEYVIAIPEAIYLMDRGMDSQAAFILLLAHIPVVENVWIQPKFNLSKDIVYGQVTELMNKYRSGIFKTPADVKMYLKTLPDATRETMEKVFKIVDEELVKNPNLLKSYFAKELKLVMNKASRGEIDKVSRAFEKIKGKYAFKTPTMSQTIVKTAKIFGVIMFPAFGINMGLTELIEENPIVKDPRRLGQIMTALESIGKILDTKQQSELANMSKAIEQKINTAILNQDYVKLVEGVTEQLNILDGIEKMQGGTITLNSGAQTEFKNNKGQITSTYVSVLIGFIMKRIYQARMDDYLKVQSKNEEIVKVLQNSMKIVLNDTKIYTDFCKNVTLNTKQIPPKTKDESCAFRLWVTQKHPEFKFEVPGYTIKPPISLCDRFELRNYPPEFYLNECGFKYAWNLYYNEYRKSTSSPQNKKLPPTKQQAIGGGMNKK
jgi:hypothetical protein